MTLPLIAALAYLLLSVRILADVRVVIGAKRKGLRIALRAWGVRLWIDKPLEFSWNREAAGQQGKKLKAFWPLIRAALRAIHWGQTDVFMRVGLDDAALTATAAGAAQAALSSLQAILGQRFPCDLRVEPAFGTSCFALSSRCIFSAAPGDIMFAVARAAVKKR